MNGYRKGRDLAVILLCMALLKPLHVWAAEAFVAFGSNWYNGQEGETFPVGVYIRGDAGIGEYHVTIQYDQQRMQYISGADKADQESGVLTLTGTGGEESIKYWLQFQPIATGEGSLEITAASVRTTEGGEFTISQLGASPVYIGVPVPEGDDREEDDTRIPAENPADAQEGQKPAEGIGGEAESLPESAVPEAGTVPQAAQPENENPPPREEETGNPQESIKREDLEAKGAGGESSQGQKEPGQKKSVFYNTYLILALTVLTLIIVVELILFRVRNLLGRGSGEEKKPEENYIPKVQVDDFDYNEDGELLIYNLKDEPYPTRIQEEKLERELGEPIIRVKDVTMEFHLSSSNPSGLKDYFIQMIKRQITYRKLYALYHVSFNVYKGEVVGIIGTNGSGKSTLLKIVSGALKPTEGKVEVNRRKVQLLTLGTGFDGELTARENVYLNGSIIGYSRKFLEEHYEDIVKFAELQDFMEEKVKNFSSGMVSRLGFAIATVGEAAEILILDEVLSVGDEFFRKKSLKRIREMIHGGSTVLMVSHGMGTILEHCTRCVWIEKGRLQMTGDPKEVCRAYQRMQPES